MSIRSTSPARISEDEGEDLAEGMEADYRAIPELDTYDQTNLDSQQYDQNFAERAAAEEEMDRRDAKKSRRRYAEPVALQEDYGDHEPQAFRNFAGNMNLPEDDVGADGGINLEDFQGPLKDWLAKEDVQIEVRRRFREFITNFTDDNGETYLKRIEEMCNRNGCSLEITYNHVSTEQPVLGVWLADLPRDLLKIFNAEVAKIVEYTYPDYSTFHKSIFVRIVELPLEDKLRDLRQDHLNQLIKVTGVVTRRTQMFPQMKYVKWECTNCYYLVGPFGLQGGKPVPPNACPQCQKKVFTLNAQETVYSNFQRLTLQESPSSVPAGRMPRSREVIVTDDLVDAVRPGEEIIVSGIYLNLFNPNLNMKNGFPVFKTVIEANHIANVEKENLASKDITECDENKIKELSKRPDIEKIITNAIAPSIYGHDYIKLAIALSLFGGVAKKKANHRIRGDINVLVLGDPGVGKSQFLTYTKNLAPRAVYATGKGASAVGLTASVRRDSLTGDWVLEGGALVLADKGVCLIDEFDKMNEQDRTSIHEAMEQQSISVSKAGIVTTLQARCAVIAAANPINGRYDSSRTFVENVDLTDPILSRFDILAVVRDHVDNVRDEMLAEFVIFNHQRSHPNATDDEKAEYNEACQKIKASDIEQISQELLKKYIIYGKRKCKPDLSKVNKEKISKFYADLRQKSMEGGGIPIAVRHIESILRMSEARAKLHLRERVLDEDVDVAIRILLESFIESQKFAVKKRLQQQFSRYLTTNTDSNSLLMHILAEACRQQQWYRSNEDDELQNVTVDLKEFESKAKALGITNLAPFYKSSGFDRAGFKLDTENGIIRKMFA